MSATFFCDCQSRFKTKSFSIHLFEVFKFQLLKTKSNRVIIVNYVANILLIMRSQIVNTLISFLIVLSFSGKSQTLINATELGVLPAPLITFSGITVADYHVRYYKVSYNTVDVSGNPTVATGMIAVPINPFCDSIPIALYAHGAVLLKSDVPSSSNQESDLGKALASRGYVVAMPDYLGLGDSQFGYHPLQHANSEATSCVDILRAAKEFISDSLDFDFSNELFLTGYSQGGHSAMATAKYIQENQLQNEFNVAGLIPISGLYNIEWQTKTILNDITFYYPGLVVYLIQSYNNVYGNLFTQWSDVLQSPYDTLIPPLLNGLNDFDVVNPLMPLKASQYFNPGFISSFFADSISKSTPIWQALLDNNIYDWTPTVSVNLLYCYADELVFQQNTLDAYDAMMQNGVADLEIEDVGNYSHLGCVVPAFGKMIEYVQEKRTDCKDPSSINNMEISTQSIVYPNPVIGQLNVKIPTLESGVVELFAMDGKMVFSETMSNNTLNFAVNQFSPGVYFIKVTTEKKVFINQLTISR